MTSPVLPADTGQLGPGTLKIGGPTPAALDISCYVNNAGLEVSKDVGDQTTKLCGAVRAAVVTYTYQLTGNLDVDLANDAGLLALSWDEAGSTQAFEFTPSTEAGTKFAGTLVIDPLNVSADEYGADLTSDFTWDIVGKPTRTVGGALLLAAPAAEQPATVQPESELQPA